MTPAHLLILNIDLVTMAGKFLGKNGSELHSAMLFPLCFPDSTSHNFSPGQFQYLMTGPHPLASPYSGPSTFIHLFIQQAWIEC